MWVDILEGLALPFIGTAAGSACVFFMKKDLSRPVQRALTGFASGVMVAASVWSLLIPAMEEASSMGKLAFIPAVAGFWLGILFLLALDRAIPHLHMYAERAEGLRVAPADMEFWAISSTLSESSRIIMPDTLQEYRLYHLL